jgi:hypothetical protein
MWLCWSRTSTDERVGEGSSFRSSGSPVSISEKSSMSRRPRAFQHFGRQHLANASLSGSCARRQRLYGVWPEPLVPRSAAIAIVAKLREQETRPSPMSGL